MPAAQPHAHLHPATSASASAASAASRALAGLVGLGCAALAAWLALHHPLSPPLALAGIALLAASQAAWRPGPRQDAGRASRRMRAWGLLLLWWLQRRQDRAAAPQAVPGRGSAAILLLASLLAGLGVWLFRSAGVTHRPP